MEACTNEPLSLDGGCNKPLCWETFVGQEFYKLTITDFLVQLALVFLVDLPRTRLENGNVPKFVCSYS